MHDFYGKKNKTVFIGLTTALLLMRLIATNKYGTDLLSRNFQERTICAWLSQSFDLFCKIITFTLQLVIHRSQAGTKFNKI